jgi:hypothetical protein
MNFISSLSFIKSAPINKIGFDDVLFAINDNFHKEIIIINTLPQNEQEFLIKGTIPYNLEEEKINKIIESGNYYKYKIIIYGKNTTDFTIETKYKQLKDFGFTQVFIYYGGLFEWVLLQDIYGDDIFSTTIFYQNKYINLNEYKKIVGQDILLKWKPKSNFI